MASEHPVDEALDAVVMPEPDTQIVDAEPVAVAGWDTEHTIFDAIRAFGVTVGPSIVFDIITFGSIPALFSKRARPFAALGATTLVAYWLVVRPWYLRWGATDAEVAKRLPGDEFEPNPAIEMTRAITIDAPVKDVWPWLAQLGQDRGGFYSYEWLENLAGCEMHNAETIHPEWQRREVGETIKLHPLAGLKVALFEPNRVFAIQNWGAYVVEPTADGRQTRLIGRARVGRGLGAAFYALCIEIPHFVMERKMLMGIKERVERARRPAG